MEILLFALIILLIDIPFVKYVIAPQYQKIGLALQVKIVSAALAYLAMILAWFLINGDPYKGALTGFVIYATYACTLSAVLPTYPLFPTGVIEIIWGTFLFSLATIITKKNNSKTIILI